MKKRTRLIALLALLLTLFGFVSAGLAQNLTIQVVYKGDTGKESLRHTSLSVVYYLNGTTKSNSTLAPGNNYTVTTTDATTDANGQPLEVSLVRVGSGIWPQYVVEGWTYANDTLTVTLAHQDKYDFDLTLKWDDLDNEGNTRPAPDPADWQLVAPANTSGREISPVSAEDNEDGTWTLSFQNFPTSYYDAAKRKEVAQAGLSYLLQPTQTGAAKAYAGQQVQAGRGVQPFGMFHIIYPASATATLPRVQFKGTIDVRNHLTGSYYNAAGYARALELGIDVPQALKLQLMNGTTEVDSAVARYTPGSSGFTHTFTLPKFDSSGQEIDYSAYSILAEPKPVDLDKRFVANEPKVGRPKPADQIQTTTYVWTYSLPGITALKANLTWEDANDQAGVRPKSLRATLLADGTPIGNTETLPLDANGQIDAYPAAWKSLPQRNTAGDYVRYSIRLDDLPKYYDETDRDSDPAYQDAASGYVGSGTNLASVTIAKTLTLQKQTADLKILFENAGSEAEKKARPTSLSVALEVSSDNGTTWQPFFGKEAYTVAPTTDPVEWTYRWDALPAVDADGNPLQYRAVQLDQLPQYATTTDQASYTLTGGAISASAFTIHNTYADAWNYAVALHWKGANPTAIDTTTVDKTALGAIYTLDIAVQKEYARGALEIRVPLALFPTRTSGKAVVPKDIGVGTIDNHTEDKPFVYRIDDKGTTDEADDDIVYYNWEPLKAGSTFGTDVTYEWKPEDVFDGSLATLTARAEGQYAGQSAPETQETAPITYRLDTGVRLGAIEKTALQVTYHTSEIYFPGFTETLDLNRYNYIVYNIVVPDPDASQDYDNIVTDTPGEGGEVVYVSYKGEGANDNYCKIVNFTPLLGGAASWDQRIYRQKGYEKSRYRVLVRYPRRRHPDPTNGMTMTYATDYTNTVVACARGLDTHPMHGTPEDQNDVSEQSATAVAHYVDYAYPSGGAILSGVKHNNGLIDGSWSLLEKGDQEMFRFYLSENVDGYGRFPDGYAMDMRDDAVYAYTTINGVQTVPARLGPDDYELTFNMVTINLTDVDPQTGAPLPGSIPTEPFILWGKKTENDDWEQVYSITLNKANQIVSGIAGHFKGKGYYALRFTSPADLKGNAKLYAEGALFAKMDSPILRQLRAQGATSVTFTNYGAYRMASRFKEDGTPIWETRKNTNLDTARTNGLEAWDKAQPENGGLVPTRQVADIVCYTASFSNALSKYADKITYDAGSQTASTFFTLEGLERIDVNPSYLTTQYRENGEARSGVFYDLLPLGWRYDPSVPTKVYGAGVVFQTTPGVYNNIVPRSAATGAAIDAIQTVDNYRGSGRQLVIFRVSSTKPVGENWYKYTAWTEFHTGFIVRFAAKAAYSQLLYGTTDYNIAAYQRGDGRELLGGQGYPEQGYGANGDQKIYALDAHGQPLLADLDGDGQIGTTKNTLYAHVGVTPLMAQAWAYGLAKQVRGRATLFARQDVVDLDGDYAYRIAMTTAKDGQTGGVVFYDILENAANTGGASGEAQGWKGTLKDITFGRFTQLDVAPKVYYSTKPNLDYEGTDGHGAGFRLDSAPDGTWSETPPADLSRVTAVAIDLRHKKSDSSDFAFPEETIVEAVLHMQAPPDLQHPNLAYNRPAYEAQFTGHSGPQTLSYEIEKRTTLTLLDLQELNVKKGYIDKVAGKDTFMPLPNVPFSLYRASTAMPSDHPGATGSSWGAPIAVTQSFADGTVKFSDLDSGTYALVEGTVPVTGFVAPGCYWTFTVDAKAGGITVPVRKSTNLNRPQKDITTDPATGELRLVNDRTVGQIKIQKTWVDGDDPTLRPADLTFELWRNQAHYETKTVTAGSGDLGVVFDNVPIYDGYGTKYTYEVVEQSVPGYTAAADKVAVGNLGPNTSVSFTNTRKGSVEISKTVPGGSTEDFDFTLTLEKQQGDNSVPAVEYDANNRILSYPARRYKDGQKDFTTATLTPNASGEITFKLSDGEQLLVYDLPLGITWKVEEKPEDGFVTEQADGSDGETGRTASGEIPHSAWVNYPLPEWTLTAEKQINGAPAPQGQTFEFLLQSDPANPRLLFNQTKWNNGKTIEFDPIPFEASDENKPYVFTLTEVTQSTETLLRDTAKYQFTVKLVRDPVAQTFKLEEKITKDGAAFPTANTVSFNNTTPPTFTPTAKKHVDGAAPKEGQKFNFELKEGDTVVGTATSNGEDIIFQTITYVEDPPRTHIYKMYETTQSTDTMFADDTVYTIRVDFDKQANGAYVANPTVEVDGQGHTGDILFNNYTAPSVLIQAEKTVNGQDPTADQVYEFTLTGGGQNQTVKNVGRQIPFERITYTLADVDKTFHYVIKEKPLNTPGFMDDPMNYTVDVKVEKQGNQYVATPTYNPDPIVFNNADAPFVELKATKTVDGQPPVGQKFSFQLTGGPDNTNKIVENDDNGNITFPKITYGRADAGQTYTYRIEEISRDTQTLLVDSSIYTVDVKIEEVDGKYSVRQTVKMNGQPHTGDILFNNYTPPSVQLTASKSFDGQPPKPDQEYTFTLTGNGQNQTKHNVLGQITFEPITYTSADAGQTYTYEIRETTTSTETLLVDPTVYKVDVKIEGKNGRYSATPTYYKQVASAQGAAPQRTPVGGATFNNYTAPSVQLTATKTVNDKTPAQDQVYKFELIDKGDDTRNQEKENDLGDITFDPIYYTLDDLGKIFTYQIRETTPSAGDLTVDPSEYQVTVHVDRNAQTGRPEATYTIQKNVNGVVSDVNAIAFDNHLILRTEFAVEKIWEDGRTDAISLTLYANDVMMDPQPTYTREGNRYVYRGLRMFDDNGDLITYAATERFVDGYLTAYVNPEPYKDVRGFVYDGGTIINRPVTSITVRKIWKGIAEDAQKPEIELLLYNDGKQIDKKPRKGEDGLYSFINLPVRSTPYYVVETPVKGYATRYENQGQYAGQTKAAYAGGTITNYLVPRTGDTGSAARALGLMALSLAGIALILRKKGRL